MMRSFWLYIYSERNLYGCVFALSGLALYFAGIIREFWFLIVPGLYLIGAMLNPPSKADLDLKQNLADSDIKNELERVIGAARRRLPKEAVEICERIKTLVVEMLPRLRSLQGTQDAFAIKQAALDYLPHTLENYLALPPAYAGIHPIKDGKTAKQILLEQLSLLETSVQEASSNVLQGDAQKILVNSRFLEDKFAKAEKFI
jgi:hypothetical protein